MTAEPTSPLNVFYSYAHKDEKLRDELGKHLYPLKRQGLIIDWYDRDISAGKEWEQEIDTHLNTSHIILLLISPDFIASDYCYGIEMKRALERHETGDARVIPILLQSVDWQGTPFRKLQMLPRNAKAVTRWPNRADAFTEVARGIRETIKDLQAKASPTLSPSSAVGEEAIVPSSANSPSSTITGQEDQSSVSELAPVWTVPYRRNPFFTGREDILQRLYRMLISDTSATSAQPRVLSGLGGIGKTQLAVEYAYRYRPDYHVVLWAKADSLEALTSDFAGFADLLNLPGRREQDQRYAVDAVKRWLEVNTNWLLILDNVEDLKMVNDYLPAAPRGHILLTSQTQVVGGVAFRLEIEKMTAEEGALFLLHRTGLLASDASLENIADADRKKAIEIAAMMDGLPLAIDQAGAYIEETRSSLAGYVELYGKRRIELLKLRGGLASQHPEPVATTWSLAFEKIEQTSPAAAELLRFFAFLHPDAISEELILRGASHLGPLLQTVATDAFVLNQAIGKLHTFSLVSRNPAAMLTVHRLVQTVLKDSMSKETQYQWAERVVRAVNQAFPEVEFHTWQDCRRYLPHAQVCAALIEQESLTFPEAARLLDQAGFYLYEQGQYPEAEPLLKQAVAIRDQTLGPEHPDIATSLNHLAELYREQGKYAQAELLYQQALTIRENLLGPMHVDLATSFNNLGLLYNAQAKYGQAEQLHQRALEIRKNLLGMEHSDVATSLNNLASLYQAEGQFAQARPLYLQSLTIKEQALGPEHPDTASSLNNLALLYQAEGQYAQARPLHQRALAICEKVLGPEHPDTASSLNNLAGFYANQRNYTQAEPLFQRALSICEQTIGSDHPTTIRILKNYATMLRQAKRNAKAKDLEDRIKTMERK